MVLPRKKKSTRRGLGVVPQVIDQYADEIEVIAIHEAGHAAVALHVGLAFERVTIGLPGRFGGRLDFPVHNSRRAYLTRRRLADRIFVLMAGEGGQRAFFRASDTLHRSAGAEDRRAAAAELAMIGALDIPVDDHDAFIEAQCNRATRWARTIRARYAILAIARALRERMTLSQAEVRDVVRIRP